MQLAFADDQVFAICTEPWRSRLADHEAESLQRWIADLEAAEHLAEVAELGLGLDLSGASVERVVFPLSEEKLLVGRIDHVRVRRGVNGDVLWDQSHRIQFTAIEVTLR